MPFAFIADHSTACIAVGLIGLVSSLGYIWFAWKRTTPVEKSGAAGSNTPVRLRTTLQTLSGIPSAVPVTPDSPSSVSRGSKVPGRNDQNQVPTEQVPALKAVLAPAVPEIQRHAERMGELGFHHSVNKEALEAKSVADFKGQPAIEASKKTEKNQHTVELDDILSRIDKVLAENPVMAVNTLGSSTDPGVATQNVNWMENTEDTPPQKS